MCTYIHAYTHAYVCKGTLGRIRPNFLKAFKTYVYMHLRLNYIVSLDKTFVLFWGDYICVRKLDSTYVVCWGDYIVHIYSTHIFDVCIVLFSGDYICVRKLDSTYVLYIHTYIHTHLHTYIHTYIHAHLHTYIHTCIRMYVHAYACMYAARCIRCRAVYAMHIQ